MSMPLSDLACFTTETLDELLDQKALTKITAMDHRTGAALNKLTSREKALLALDLARCLLEFFEEDVDLASHSWKPKSLYFLRSTKGQIKDRILYISLRPTTTSPTVQSPKATSLLGPGNPILLSFARLLLEINDGQRMEIEINSEGKANLPQWGEMCDTVHRVGREGSGSYLQAVEGCLYLHMALRKFQNQERDLSFSDIVRKAIHEQIIRNLELSVNPQNLKRKRRDSVSEIPLAKKLSFAPPATAPGSQVMGVPTNHTTSPLPTNTHRPSSRDQFEVAIVCALSLEFDAVSAALDDLWHGDYGRAPGDSNIYTNGRIGKFNVVLLLLPNMGKISAAGASASLRSSYQALSLVLVPGICGGVPFPENGEEVLLGDVIISKRIVQYDLGWQYPDQFETRNTVEDRFGRAPKNVRNLLAILETNVARERMEKSAALYLQDIQASAARKHRGPGYRYPGAAQDRLFQSDYRHERHGSSQTLSLGPKNASITVRKQSSAGSCIELGCDSKRLVRRERLQLKENLERERRVKEAQAPYIFVGTIGSGDTVMKSGEERDRIASEHGLIAFEMEGAGVWDELPCIVVKAVCDYADSHKNKGWQNFAAATAASVTKALLDWYIQQDKTSQA